MVGSLRTRSQTNYCTARSFKLGCLYLVAALFAVLGLSRSPAEAQSLNGGFVNGYGFTQSAAYKRKKKRARSYNRSRNSASRSRNTSSKKKVQPAPEPTVVAEAEKIPGPVQIVVSLTDQRAHIYKGTKRIATTRVSTGKAGHRTPQGVFHILQKNRRHFSNIYGGAPMPYMQRITWSGVALHAGVVPGYPASHGCIRLPHSFAKTLFGLTEMGQHVVVTEGLPDPALVSSDTLLQPVSLEQIIGTYPHKHPSHAGLRGGVTEVAAAEQTGIVADGQAGPYIAEDAAAAALMLGDLEFANDRMSRWQARSREPLRILITKRTERENTKDVQEILNELGFDAGEADGYVGKMTRAAIRAFEEANGLPVDGEVTDALVEKLYSTAGRGAPPTGQLYVRQKYREIYSASVVINDLDRPLGTHLYTAMDFTDSDDRTNWTSLTLVESKKVGASTPKEAIERINIPENVRRDLALLLTPGSSIIVSDNGIGNETGKYTNYIVQTY